MTTNHATTVPHALPSAASALSSPELFVRAHADDAILYAGTAAGAPLRFTTGRAATAALMGEPTIHSLWRTTQSTESSPTVEPRLYWAIPHMTHQSSSPTTATNHTENNYPFVHDQASLYGQQLRSSTPTDIAAEGMRFKEEADPEPAAELDSVVVPQLDWRLLAEIFRYIANELDSAVPDENLHFLIAASLVVWPDLDPFKITSDDSEEDDDDPDLQVMHLVVNGEYDNFENSYPLGLMTTPLPSLHTLQLNSIALRSINRLEYSLQDLERLSIWNCHVSTQGLFLLLRSAISLTHFTIGGKRMQVVENSNDASSDPVILPPSFPHTLQFLHLDICALVNWQGSPINNPFRPRMVSWLGHLHGPLSLSVFECKLFTNDIHLPKEIISLAEETLRRLRFFIVETHVGSAYLYLGRLPNLQTLEVLCVESRVADVVEMLRSITTSTFQHLSIFIPLTSLDLSFSSLNALNVAAHQGILRSNRHIDIYLLCRDGAKQAEMRQESTGFTMKRMKAGSVFVQNGDVQAVELKTPLY
ncbi:uncharacterized protein ARMOST_19886 [Armillaria ostoyae]|uniref:Uncharacterized protein n=1 Tax=Armillaria ostoyae TaxID=47428 RepID=A0A284S5S8_ARMOS|nr:uncharacterized protein ARMOST_19886 [Armillaria ostoyae]